MDSIILGKQRVKLDPKKLLGQGGEAAVYEHNGAALKVYFEPSHPVFSQDPSQQKGARDRLDIIQRKLPAFPKGLPSQVVAPQELAYDASNNIMGYTMRLLKGAEVLLRYSEKAFRQQGVPNSKVISAFRELYGLVNAAHSKGIVIGDFNDLNVMVGTEIYLVDTDSFQFTGRSAYGEETFPCKTFTQRFVDPLLCKKDDLVLNAPHNELSDWYAFCVMLFQSLLFVDPYGGVYKPKNPADRINQNDRPLRRVTVFNPEVKYPKPAIPYGVLPDDLLQFFIGVFEKDNRLQFPEHLLGITWTTCVNCGLEHARPICPNCAKPGAVKEVTTIRGNVTCTTIFKTNGLILNADYQHGKLLWLHHERGAFHREDGTQVSTGALDPTMRFRVQGNRTIIGKGNLAIQLQPGFQPQTSPVDSFGTLPVFDTNGDNSFYLHNGVISRMSWGGPNSAYFTGDPVGNVLQNQTLFWTGEDFAFGFYRAGEMQIALTFDPKGSAINDSISIPRIQGQLVDSTCVFGTGKAWIFISTNENGRTINRCYLLKKGEKTVSAMAQTEGGDGSWLGTIRGKTAASDALFASTDDGIVRIEASGNHLAVTKAFPDTEPFVDSRSNLFVGNGGIYAVSAKEVKHIKIS